jgi:hypothetical protein
MDLRYLICIPVGSVSEIEWLCRKCGNVTTWEGFTMRASSKGGY